MSSPADGTVLHLYGVVHDWPGTPLPPGVGGAPVAVEEVAGLSVLVSSLDSDRYGPEVWRDRGQDPAWLAQVATEHHAVLQAAIEQADLLPLRLPSVYLDHESVERALAADASSLGARLAALQGQVEVAAKVFLDAAAASRAAPEPGAPRTGRDYLARKAAQKTDQEQARERRRQAVVALHEALDAASTHSVLSPAQDASLSGRPEPMLLNAAYLVPRTELEEFGRRGQQLAGEVAGQGLVLELSGPWPPYSFTTLGDGTEAGMS